ncbi:nitroreductase [Micromonospora sp. CPCC 205371]|nr:nitroreductase [Micromonospora sp. CPCC 205371]
MSTTIQPQIDLREAVAAAIRAPSMHNSQPWRFRLREGGIDVYADPARRLPVSDPSGWAARIACGAAIYNLRLAFAVQGSPALVEARPDLADPDLMARVRPGPARPATPAARDRYAAIWRRHSNRLPFWPDPVPGEARARLIAAARAEAAWLELLIGSGPLAAVSEIAHAAHRVLHRDPQYATELSGWTRHVPAPDGVPAAAGGPSPEPTDLLPGRPFGDRPRAAGRDFEADPLVAVLGTASNSPGDQIRAGQALQAVLLTVTDAGLAASMHSQPIEVAAARESLRTALGRFGTPQMVLRIGYGQPGYPTPRRDPADVIEP